MNDPLSEINEAERMQIMTEDLAKAIRALAQEDISAHGQVTNMVLDVIRAAGFTLKDLLSRRPEGMPPPMQMTVWGEYSGNAYPELKQYVVEFRVNDDEDFEILVEDEVTHVGTRATAQEVIEATELKLPSFEGPPTAGLGLGCEVRWEVGGYESTVYIDPREAAEWLKRYLDRDWGSTDPDEKDEWEW